MIDGKSEIAQVARRDVLITGASVAVILISGCQVPGSGTPPRRIRLSGLEEFPPNLPSVAWTLLVQEPDATLALNTAKIAYIGMNGDINYLSTGEWSSRAPEMVMELLVESFKNTGKISPSGIAAREFVLILSWRRSSTPSRLRRRPMTPVSCGSNWKEA